MLGLLISTGICEILKHGLYRIKLIDVCMRYQAKQPKTVVRKEEGLTSKEKEEVLEIMQKNDKALKILARM